MTKKSKNYWQKRQEQWIKNQDETDAALTKRLERRYKVTARELENDIAGYFKRYGEDDVVQYREMLKGLSKKDKDLLYQDLESFAKKYPDYEHLMPVRESVYKLNRLQGLHYSTELKLLELGAIEQAEFEKHLIATYGKHYENVMKELGIGFSFNSALDKVAEKTAFTKWVDDKNFSDRIWDNKSKLMKYMKDDLKNGLIRGDNYDKMTAKLAKRMDVGSSDAKRLVWTESSFVLNQAHSHPYIDLGVVEYELNAIRDSRTSVICRELDGEKFKFDEMEVGENFPPLHAYCRTTFISVGLDDILDGESEKQDDSNLEFNEHLSSKLSKEHQEHYEDILNNAPEEERMLWEKYQDDLTWANNFEKRRDTAYFKPSEGVTLNTTQDLEGSWFSSPGTVFYHEFGHNIDYLSGDHNHYQGNYMHKKFATAKMELSNGKTLGDTVISEVRRKINTKKGTAVEKRAALRKEMIEEYELDIPAMATISDLYGGATDNKMILGAGHDKDYWKKPTGSMFRGINGREYRSDKVGSEAFAEMYSATVRNSKEVEKFQKWLPESYEMYKELVSKMAGG